VELEARSSKLTRNRVEAKEQGSMCNVMQQVFVAGCQYLLPDLMDLMDNNFFLCLTLLHSVPYNFPIK
jgi:hypothetical protein